jgi:hypothetical protein
VKFDVPDGTYNNVNINPECLLEDRLDPSKVKKIESSTLARRDENVYITLLVSFIADDGAENGYVRDPARGQRRL